MTSDGVYKPLSAQQIAELAEQHADDAHALANALVDTAVTVPRTDPDEAADNATAAVITLTSTAVTRGWHRMRRGTWPIGSLDDAVEDAAHAGRPEWVPAEKWTVTWTPTLQRVWGDPAGRDFLGATARTGGRPGGSMIVGR